MLDYTKFVFGTISYKSGTGSAFERTVMKMDVEYQAPTVKVTIPLLRRWITCAVNLQNYAADDDQQMIDLVLDKTSGKKIKIILDKI